jgi:hypothetical protein
MKEVRMRAETVRAPTATKTIERGIIGSLIASLAFGMWTMLVEAILRAGQGLLQGFFSPVEYIAATVLGGFNNPNFFPAGQLPPVDPLMIVLGLMGHMMNSVILGLLFVWIASHLNQSRGWQLLAGIVYAVLVFFIMWAGVVPVVDPVMLRVNFGGFLVAHVIYGIGLGLTAPWANHAAA